MIQMELVNNVGINAILANSRMTIVLLVNQGELVETLLPLIAYVLQVTLR